MKHTLSIARALFESATLPDIFDPERLASHTGLPSEVIQRALESGEMAGREFEQGSWRITKRAALDWIEGRERRGQIPGTPHEANGGGNGKDGAALGQEIRP